MGFWRQKVVGGNGIPTIAQNHNGLMMGFHGNRRQRLHKKTKITTGDKKVILLKRGEFTKERMNGATSSGLGAWTEMFVSVYGRKKRMCWVVCMCACVCTNVLKDIFFFKSVSSICKFIVFWYTPRSTQPHKDTYSCTHTRRHTHTQRHTFTRSCTHTHTHTHARTHTHTHTHTHTQTHLHTLMHMLWKYICVSMKYYPLSIR